MQGPGRHIETEIKLAISSAAEAKRLLRQAGFRLRARRAFERNLVYDTPEGGLRRGGRLLRVRTWGRRSLLTFKGPPLTSRLKSREELETRIADADALGAIFERMGLLPGYRYEKFRAEYEVPGERGAALLDETPIGVFVELEGAPRWIDRSASRMGFRRADYVTSSYGTLYAEDCRRRGIPPGDMVFAASRPKRGAPVSTAEKST